MKKLFVGLLSLLLFYNPVFAQESQSYLSLGGSLSEEQQLEMKSIFQAEDISEENTFTIDGKTINDYLNDGSTEDDGVYSSSYVTMLPEGSGLTVIILTPDNITKVNQRTYENAAISAGAKDALIQIGSVQPVTGEGALAGVYEIFSQTGQELDKVAIQTAEKQIKIEHLLLEETNLSADEIATLITKLNIDVIELIEGSEEPTDDEIKDLIDNFIIKNDLDVTEDIKDALYQHAIDFAASPVAFDPATKEALLASLPDETTSSGEITELFTGEWIVGEDIEPGRYQVTCSNSMSGNFFLHSDENKKLPILNLILGDTSFGFGVPEVNLTLEEGQLIEILNLDGVMFQPIKSEFTKELTSGTWTVGVDVEPGKYIATTSENTSGNVFVYDESQYPNGVPSFNSILGQGENNYGTEKAQIKLEEGQIIVISGVHTLYLD